ncbi:MAG: DUF4325 domain-containing protein [Patescibacteria group bacterium]|nr:STAS-like domain-containing protein [Patescibacteria group bacterium]
MYVYLNQFGRTLTSRQNGKEAYAILSSNLSSLDEKEKVEIDFSGVVTFTPSWGDEVLTPLSQRFGDRVVFLNTENPSVKMTLSILQESRGH